MTSFLPQRRQRFSPKSVSSNLILVMVGLHLLLGICQAQSAASSGQVVGQILDSQGAAIPGAEIAVRNTKTNYTRAAAPDNEGRYAVSLLPLGTYEIRVEARGFKPTVQEVNVTLGSSITANFNLGVGAISASVQVRGGERTIEPTRTWTVAMLNDEQITDLPSNGRRVQSFTLLTPTTQIEPECRGFSISGQKGIHTVVNIDGGDYTSTFACGLRGRSESAPTFGLDAIAELQVIRNIFSAEFGRSTGGVINISTKSGTNDFHGSLFYFLRDKNLSAKDAFDREALARIQQFGGSLSGPIFKNRTFFITSLDVQKATKPVQVLYAVLDTQNIRNTLGAQTFLANAPEEEFSAISNSQSLITRIDHQFSKHNSLFARFDLIGNKSLYNPGANALSTSLGIDTVTNRALSGQAILSDRNYTLLTQLTSLLSPKYVNEFRFGYARENRPRSTVGTGPEVTVRNSGTVIGLYGPQASGLSFGNVGFRSSDDRYQVVDNFSVVTGAHTAKFGFDYTRTSGNMVFDAGSNGLYDFNSLADYLARRPRQYQQFAGSGSLNLLMNELAFYVQDEWRLRPGLTLSPGFRYEAAFNPDYEPATVPQNRFPTATGIPDDAKMFAPRLGLAWDVGNKGKTVVRAGGGIFYARSFLSLFAQSILFNGGNPELGSRVVVNDPTVLANAFSSIGINLATAPLNNLPVFTTSQLFQLFGTPAANTGLSVNFYDPNLRNPRAIQWKIGIDHELAKGIIAGIDFTYINTTRIARQRDVNLPASTVDATGRRIYSGTRPFGPKFFIGQATESSARSLYRGLTTSLNARRSRYTFDLYYTLSWKYAHDDTERGISGLTYDDAFNLANEYGLSNIDQRHQFVANGLYHLPYGFEVSSTARFISGRPLNALAGTDLNRDGQLSDRPIVDGQVFIRNAFRNTAFKDVSLRVQRGFTFSNERSRLMFSVEMFNLFGFDNVQIGSANQVYGPGTVISNGQRTLQPPPSNFRQLRDAQGNYLKSNVAGDPFQVQVGVRYVF